MKLVIRLESLSIESYKLLTAYGYDIIFIGWGEVECGTLELSV